MSRSASVKAVSPVNAAPADQAMKADMANVQNTMMIGDAGHDTLSEIEAELKAQQLAAEKLLEAIAEIAPAAGDEAAANEITPEEALTAQIDELAGSVIAELLLAEEIDAASVSVVEPSSGNEAATLAQIEPAAGETGESVEGGGFGFQSSFINSPIPPLEAIGPLGPTALAFNVNFPEPNPFDGNLVSLGAPTPVDFSPSVAPAVSGVDETNIDQGTSSVSGELQFSFGGDGAGEVSPNGAVETSLDAQGIELTSGGQPVTISATADGYVGVDANGDVLFTLTIDPLTGDYVFELTGPIDHIDPNDPNDFISIQFGVTITDSDGDAVQTTITINIFDDGPAVEGATVNVDESDPVAVIRGDLNVDFGADGAGEVAPNGAFESSLDAQGIELTSGGQPVTVIQVDGGYVGVTPDGQTVFTLKIQADGTYGFQLEGPLDHPDGTDPNDLITLQFGVTVTDGDGDSVTTTITVNINDDGPSIGAKAESSVDETNGASSVSGTLDVDFGADGSGAVAPNGGFDSSLDAQGIELTSGGEQVTVTATADGYVGMTSSGDIIFTLTLNPETGEYEFNLLGTLDHPDGTDPNDAITLNFGVTVTDGDGDSVQTTISINVNDDGPSVCGNGQGMVDESNPDPSVSGTLDIDFGADGAGDVAPNGNFASSINGLSSEGSPITVSASGDGYVGVNANGDVIFTLTLNPATGAYEFTLLGTLDHPDGSNPNDLISLNFGVTVTDGDGDSVTTTITIHVADDGPVAQNDSNHSDNGETVSGNVVTNDDIGADGNDAPVTQVEFNGVTYDMPEDGILTVEGEYGTLVMNADGTYTYTPNGTGDGTDTFTYTITDGDGDTAQAHLSICVDGDSIPTVVGDKVLVDETNLGPVTVTGEVVANFGGDGPGTYDVTGDVDVSGSVAGGTLTSGGEAVTITAVDGGYVGTSASGETIFTLTLNPDTGEFEFTLIGVLDHADTTNPNDVITLDFGVIVTDADGDTATTVITVHVADDGPSIGNTSRAVSENSLENGGQIVVNGTVAHDYGSDGPGDIEPTGNFTAMFQMGGPNEDLTSGGEAVTVTATADGYVGVTASGDVAFTLTINADGTYSYTQLLPIDHPGQGADVIWLKFEIQIVDGDGDIQTATIGIDLHDSVPEVCPPAGVCVDETNLGPVVVGGQIIADFGADGAGEVAGNGDFSATGSVAGGELTSGGVEVVVTQTPEGGYVGMAGGEVIFTLSINPETGEYEFTLIGPLDHANTNNPNDILTLNFGVSVTDGDGDAVNTVISVCVADDGPSVVNDCITVQEDGCCCQIVVNGCVPHDFGADGPGTLSLTGNFSVTIPGCGQQTLTVGGQPVVFTQVGNGFIGMVGTEVVFSLAMDPSTGQYTYQQFADFDHTGGSNVISLSFEVRITDADGDSDLASINVNVLDAPGLLLMNGDDGNSGDVSSLAGALEFDNLVDADDVFSLQSTDVASGPSVLLAAAHDGDVSDVSVAGKLAQGIDVASVEAVIAKTRINAVNGEVARAETLGMVLAAGALAELAIANANLDDALAANVTDVQTASLAVETDQGVVSGVDVLSSNAAVSHDGAFTTKADLAHDGAAQSLRLKTDADVLKLARLEKMAADLVAADALKGKQNTDQDVLQAEKSEQEAAKPAAHAQKISAAELLYADQADDVLAELPVLSTSSKTDDVVALVDGSAALDDLVFTTQGAQDAIDGFILSTDHVAVLGNLKPSEGLADAIALKQADVATLNFAAIIDNAQFYGFDDHLTKAHTANIL
jgi:T1SS-143 domain-containing protein